MELTTESLKHFKGGQIETTEYAVIGSPRSGFVNRLGLILDIRVEKGTIIITFSWRAQKEGNEWVNGGPLELKRDLAWFPNQSEKNRTLTLKAFDESIHFIPPNHSESYNYALVRKTQVTS